MERMALLTLFVLLVTAELLAGPIYGSIFRDGAPLRGARVTVQCGAMSASGSTLDDGSYRVHVPQPGRCAMVVTMPGVGAARGEIVSSDGAVQYNFAVVRGGGGWELRRQ